MITKAQTNPAVRPRSKPILKFKLWNFYVEMFCFLSIFVLNSRTARKLQGSLRITLPDFFLLDFCLANKTLHSSD